MTDIIAEIRTKIKAVEVALGTFADFDNQEERRIYMRQNFAVIPVLKTYFGFSEAKLQDVLNKLLEKENLLLTQQQQVSAFTGRAPTIDCTGLKNALLSAKVEGGFLCLSGLDVFPVSLKETTDKIPSKLLIRSFHGEVNMIIKKMMVDREARGNIGGAIFFGPSGTGKSWASQAVLVDELRHAKVSAGQAVVYFDSAGKRAFVFSKERS
eukprot:scaffold4614_cov180-Ochromonas_danica.AAC.1